MTRPLFLALPILAAACTGQPAPRTPGIGMPNPASAHCVSLGGTLEIRRSPAGDTGHCHLPDGRVVEEWQLFRATHPG